MITKTTKKDLGKKTLEFTLQVDKGFISSLYSDNFGLLSKELVAPGFRKGTAPKEIAEKHIKKDEVYKKVISALLPKLYEAVVKEQDVKPIVNPKIELIKAKDGEDWEVKMTVVETPQVKLNDYKKKLSELNKDQKKDGIWVPGKEPEKKTTQEEEAKKMERLNKTIELLLNEVSVEISDVLIEEEVQRKLSKLVDDIAKLGLTVDAYLASKNETAETLKAKYTKEMLDTYAIEFILQQIALDEKITVEKEDLDKLFGGITDEAAKQEAYNNAYSYASILRRQKVLDYLMNL